MHPLIDRLADAYRPLAGRNRLVEGSLAPSPSPSPVALPPPRRRLTLLALVAALCGRRP